MTHTTTNARHEVLDKMWEALFMLEDDLYEEGMLDERFKSLISTMRGCLRRAENSDSKENKDNNGNH